MYLIKKVRTVPIEILILEALLRRLRPDYPKITQIQAELAKRKKGYRGELSLNYYFDLIDTPGYLILHNIRIYDGKSYFQIDTLIITSSFYLIIEIKNIGGTLYFEDESKQMIRTYNNEEEGMSNPILQAGRHSYQLKKWLALRKLPILPIEYLVVFSDPKTIIKASKPSIFTKVLQSQNLPFTFEKIEKRHQMETLTMKEIRRIAAIIEKYHTPNRPEILSKFSIIQSDIQKGVICPKCFALPMIREKGFWHCEKCHAKSADAHIEALRDYAMFINSAVTNQEVRQFLQISSSKVARNILESMNLSSTGNTKSKTYHLST